MVEIMHKAQPLAFEVSGLGLASTGGRPPFQTETEMILKKPGRSAYMKPPMPNRPKPASLLLANHEDTTGDSFNIAGTQIGAAGKENVFKDS